MKSSRAILVFHQAPGEEAARKRLLRGGSWQRARRLLDANLRHTMNVARQTGGADVILCYDNVRPAGGGVARGLAQVGHRFGDRMRNAAQQARAWGYRDILIIGTDSPGLTVGVLRSAFQALKSRDYVVGPSVDGGFFLLGFGASRVDDLPILLGSLPWFTRNVLTQLLRRLSALGAPHARLDALADVDGWADASAVENGWDTLEIPPSFFSSFRWSRPASAVSRWRLRHLNHTAVPAPPRFALL